MMSFCASTGQYQKTTTKRMNLNGNLCEEMIKKDRIWNMKEYGGKNGKVFDGFEK